MKYYVTSNELKVIIAGPHIKDAEEAACEAFLSRYRPGINISPLIIVSQRGFDYCNHENDEDKVFDTCDILTKVGL